MENKFYVYEWFLNDGRVFYVGKGTGKRYNHILEEIKNNNKHGYYYKKLQESFGINYRIVKDNLSENEALCLESELIKQRRSEGNFLIQYIVDFSEQDKALIKENIEQAKIYASRKFKPCIKIDSFHSFYFGLKDFDISFDSVTKELLKNPYTSYTRGLLDNNSCKSIENEKALIEKYIISTNGKISKNYLKSSSVVIYNDLDYIKYLEYKKENLPIIHSFDVLQYINDNPIEEEQKTGHVSFCNEENNYKILLQNKPTAFPNLQLMTELNTDSSQVYQEGKIIEKENPFLAIWFYEANLLTENPWYYFPCYRLSILYKKLKLYKELYRILLLAIDKAERDKSFFETKLEQLKKEVK